MTKKQRLLSLVYTIIILLGSSGFTYYNYSNGFAMGAGAFPGVVALILLPFLFMKNKEVDGQ